MVISPGELLNENHSREYFEVFDQLMRSRELFENHDFRNSFLLAWIAIESIIYQLCLLNQEHQRISILLKKDIRISKRWLFFNTFAFVYYNTIPNTKTPSVRRMIKELKKVQIYEQSIKKRLDYKCGVRDEIVHKFKIVNSTEAREMIELLEEMVRIYGGRDVNVGLSQVFSGF